MPSLYKSILLAQPADGDVVFVRRFTRDPPLLATWIAPLRIFITGTLFDIHLEGSTLDGTYSATFQTNLLGSGKPGWLATSGGDSIYFLPQPWGLISLGARDGGGNGFYSPASTWYGGNPSCFNFADAGVNPFGLPLDATFTPHDLSQLILPAALVSAWRPQ